MGTVARIALLTPIFLLCCLPLGCDEEPSGPGPAPPPPAPTSVPVFVLTPVPTPTPTPGPLPNPGPSQPLYCSVTVFNANPSSLTIWGDYGGIRRNVGVVAPGASLGATFDQGSNMEAFDSSGALAMSYTVPWGPSAMVTVP